MVQDGTATRIISLSAERQADSMVQIIVQDSGRGVSAEDQEQVFEPFVTARPDGMGLGLPICRNIIEAHGGELWAEPSEMGGRFCLTLPAA